MTEKKAKQAVQATERLRDIMHVREGGMDLLDLLESAAKGEMSATVGTSEMEVNATRKRVKRAHDLVNGIKDFHFESSCPKSAYMAWLVLGKAATLAQNKKPSSYRSEFVSGQR